MTRDECLNAAARVWADTCAREALLTPRQAAIEAHQPGGPSVDELEQQIRTWRAAQREPVAA